VSDRTADAPATLRAAVALLYAEAAGLAVLAAVELYDTLTQRATSHGFAVFLGVVLVLLTGLVGFLAYRLSIRRAGARNPAVALHVLALPIGYYLFEAGQYGFGVLAFAICAAGIGLLLASPTTRALDLH
jgi:hypothetical protein